MQKQRWQHVQDLFERIVEQPLNERGTLLQQWTAGDDDLCQAKKAKKAAR